MNHTVQLGLFLSGTYPCSYLPNRQARSQVLAQNNWVTPSLYSQLIEQGFRRIGTNTCRPRCDQCQACVPVRLIAKDFNTNKTQKRIYKKHQLELSMQIIDTPFFSAEHYSLYEQYQYARHSQNDEPCSPESYEEFLIHSFVDTHFIEYRSLDNTLRMVSIFDKVENGLSAVYTFYDPLFKGSLGTYAILCLQKLCVNSKLPYLYLGYWVKESKKMDYKINYQPLEFYFNGHWSKQDCTT